MNFPIVWVWAEFDQNKLNIFPVKKREGAPHLGHFNQPMQSSKSHAGMAVYGSCRQTPLLSSTEWGRPVLDNQAPPLIVLDGHLF